MIYKIIGGLYDGARFHSAENLPYTTKLILGSVEYVLTPLNAEPVFIAQKERNSCLPAL